MNDSISPVLRLFEYFLLHFFVPLKCLECEPYRFRIDVSHQFANKLILTSQRTSRLYAGCSDDGIVQLFLERHARDLLVR